MVLFSVLFLKLEKLKKELESDVSKIRPSSTSRLRKFFTAIVRFVAFKQLNTLLFQMGIFEGGYS